MKTRKILAMVLSLVMLFSLCSAAFAVYTDAELEAFGLGGYTPNEVANDKISREIALDSYVLLENNGVLPIEKGGKVALFGSGATGTVKGGTGSGIVNQRERDWIDEALEAAGFEITTPQAYRDAVGRGVVATGFSGSRMANDVNLTDAWLQEAMAADTAIYVIGRNAGEGSDRQLASGDGAFQLTAIERANIEKVAANFENVIMVYNTQITDVSWMEEVDNIDALLHIGYGGQRTGATTVQVLTGEVSPSGKTTSTWAMSINDYASAQSGFSWIDGNTTTEYYKDGIYVGYRYFDTFGKYDEVAYPFGFGLSYTEFDINVVDVAADAENVTVVVDVTNVGTEYSGKEVVQIYFSAPDGELEKPYQELAAFAKTDVLAPGEKQTLTITFATTDMSSYSEDRAAYIMDAGDYIIRVGNGSRSTEVAAVITLTELAVTEQLSNQVVLEENAVLEEISKEGIAPITYEGEADEIAAAKANAIVLEEVAFLGNNASEYDDETITTYLFADEAENYVARKNIIIRSKSVAGILDNRVNNKGYMETSYDEVVEVVDALPEGMTAETVKLTDVVEGKITLKQFVASLTEWELARLAQGQGSTSGVGYIYDDEGNVVASSHALPGNVGRTTHELFATRHIPVLGYCDGPAGIRCDQDGVTSPQINQNNRVGGTYFYSSDGGITVDRSSSSVQLNQSFAVEGSGRYVKLNLTEPGTQYGFSIYEFTINAQTPSGMDNVALNKPVTVKSEAANDGNIASKINDGSTSTRWGSDYYNGDTDNSWVIIDLGEVYDFSSMGVNFEAAYAGAYTVQVSNDGETYTTIYNSKDAPEQEDTRVRYWVLPTAFPSSSNLACTWNTDSMYDFGYGLGAEQAEYCVGAWLAPGMNIVRHPLCGRNFEYYSEDPLVTGMAAANVTAGVQTHKGGGVTIKHYWGNNQENNRNAENNVMSERAAREIYLKGYEIAIKLAQPMFLMTCYNENNGWPGGDSYDSCTDLARGEWGFNGLIMTDWNGGQSSPHVSMHGGNDMITPGKNVTTITNYIGITAPTFRADGRINSAGSFEAAKGGTYTYTAPVASYEALHADVITAIANGQATFTVNADGGIVTWYGNHVGRIVRGDVQKSALNILVPFLYSQDMQMLCEELGVDYANTQYAEKFSVAMDAPMANGWTNVEKSEVVNASLVAGTVEVDATEATTVEVPVSYNGNEEITSVRFTADSEIGALVAIESDYEVTYNANNGQILVYEAEANNISGVLATLVYDVSAVPANGEYAVDVEIIDATGADTEQTTLIAVDGAVIVNNTYDAGDVNLDGEVSNADLIMIARYLVELEEFDAYQIAAADIDSDGEIDNADLVKLARVLVEA